jgi:hypothetical protein
MQDVIQLQGAIKLINWLPGDNAKDFRGKASEVLTRYFAGDMTLIEEIETNKRVGARVACESFITNTIASVKREREAITSMPKSSWIYGTQSDAFPGLIKIGRSRNVKARISSGNTFCAPEPHVVVAAAPTFDAIRDEDATHEYFSDFRVQGEFFRISESSLQAYFTQVLTPIYHKELNEFSDRLPGKIAGYETLVVEIEVNESTDIKQLPCDSTALSVENDDAYSQKRKRMIEDIELEEKRLKNEELASIIRMRNAEAQVRENEAKRYSMELEKQQVELRILNAQAKVLEAALYRKEKIYENGLQGHYH